MFESNKYADSENYKSEKKLIHCTVGMYIVENITRDDFLNKKSLLTTNDDELVFSGRSIKVSRKYFF